MADTKSPQQRRAKVIVFIATLCVCLLSLEVAMRCTNLGSVREVVSLHMWGYFYPANPPLFYRPERLRTDGATYLDVDWGPNNAARKTRRFAFKKPPGTFRIVCVGDSLTEEWAVAGYDNYTDRLARLVAAAHPGVEVEVIPLGVGGYTTYQEAELLDRSFEGLETDVLVAQYCHNDVDVVRCADCPADADDRRDLAARDLHVVQERRLVVRPPRFFASHLLARSVHAIAHALGGSGRYPGLTLLPEGDHHRRGFERLKASAARRHVPFVVVQFPRMESGDPQPELRYSRGLLDELAIPTLDLTRDLERVAPLEQLCVGDAYHPNGRGHDVAARSLYDYLVAQHALDGLGSAGSR